MDWQAATRSSTRERDDHAEKKARHRSDDGRGCGAGDAAAHDVLLCPVDDAEADTVHRVGNRQSQQSANCSTDQAAAHRNPKPGWRSGFVSELILYAWSCPAI